MTKYRIATMAFLPLLLVLVPARSGAQTNPCDTDGMGPFVVQSSRAFTVQWCTAVTRPDPNNPGQMVAERVDGHYLQIDAGTKTEIAATNLGISAVTNRQAWQYVVAAGVPRGIHALVISSWNYVLDSSGNPTTVKQEGASTSVPFTAVDPMLPLAPTGVRLIR